MNRIKQYNNGYHLLLTPSNIYDSGTEILSSDLKYFNKNVNEYRVYYYSDLNNALLVSEKHSDIDWKKLYIEYIDTYHFLKKEFERIYPHILSHLMSPEEIKEAFFHRVHANNYFIPSHHMCDIISFKVNNICENLLHGINHGLYKTHPFMINNNYTFDYVVDRTIIGMTLWGRPFTIIF